MASDPIWFDGTSIKAPRVVLHVAYPILNDGIDHGLQYLRIPGYVRKPIVTLGLPLVFHLNQARQGLKGGNVYQLNVYDWVYDYVNKQPLHPSKRAIITRAINSTLLSPFARP